MWFAGIVVTPLENEVVELWQLPHSPDSGWFGSCAGVGRVTIVTPKNVLPASWHVAHGVPATGAWFLLVPPKLVNFEAEWQLSHAAVPIGMCVPGCVTIVTPKKLLPLAWQFVHPDVIPAWFIVPPLKLLNFAGEWQSSQGCEVGMCVGGGATGVTFANESPLEWQVAHPLVMPVWFIVATEKFPGVVWHSAQGCAVGMWFAGWVVTPAENDVVELWQLPQSPVCG